MFLAQISDTHILSPEVDHPSQALRPQWLRQCVADINRQQPDAVIFTGDTVQHGWQDEYEILRNCLESLEVPVYLVPGNRDVAAELRKAFADKSFLSGPNEFLQYVIEDHDVRLVGLDSTSPGERKGHFCERRRAWLDAVLSAQPERPTVLFVHHPPFDVGDHYVGGYRIDADAAGLEAVVSRHAQVEALICGHVHWPIEAEWAGTRARIMPSVAVDLRKGVDEEAAGGQPVYMLHHWSPEGGLDSRMQFASPAS